MLQSDSSPTTPQMPAYHLIGPDNTGITFINIGVGPSNAKTITDHLAVLRPHCWLMIGHCAGLRYTQELGDYVLAHAYARDDQVLNHDLAENVPIPAIGEVQNSLLDAIKTVTGHDSHEMYHRTRVGTVLTTDNRNWELRAREMFPILQRSRAIAVDMESATIAANGFRLRVPYGTLLCVSDKPVHGELKLKSSASEFYRQRVQQHLKIGINAVENLRKKDDIRKTRKLRGFYDPPFQ